jgi:hypothetical protein
MGDAKSRPKWLSIGLFDGEAAVFGGVPSRRPGKLKFLDTGENMCTSNSIKLRPVLVGHKSRGW